MIFTISNSQNIPRENLKEAIEKANYTELSKIASKAVAFISFWGTRNIHVPGYEGNASVDCLARKVIELVQINNFEYTKEDRATGKEIAKEISRIYKNSDKQKKESNYCTWLCCVIQDFALAVFPRFPLRATSYARAMWEDELSLGNGWNLVFDYYTPKQFYEKNNCYPAADDLSNANSLFIPPKNGFLNNTQLSYSEGE